MRKNLENALNSDGFLMHLEGTPSHYLFQLFLKCKVDQMKIVSISQVLNYL